MTRYSLLLLFFFIGELCYSQQYNTLEIEKVNTDLNNNIYKIGNAFTFDYEIIIDGNKYRLNRNGRFPGDKFTLVKEENDTLGLKIQLIVPKVDKSQRTNKKQTEIYYLFEPDFSSLSGTGVVENENNIWLHPPRSGFFSALETCPFPYVKYPIEIGKNWQDKMKIGDHWCDEKWGVWKKKLLLLYDYKIKEKTNINTKVGALECYVIESNAKSEIGESKLKSYFSEKYGFIRLEYEMATGLRVNLWIDHFSENNNFNDFENIGKYITEQKKTIANILYK
ncbi:hypothetical protein [Labilibaculum euxinus]